MAYITSGTNDELCQQLVRCQRQEFQTRKPTPPLPRTRKVINNKIQRAAALLTRYSVEKSLSSATIIVNTCNHFHKQCSYKLTSVIPQGEQILQ
jgi:hypothetical protein